MPAGMKEPNDILTMPGAIPDGMDNLTEYRYLHTEVSRCDAAVLKRDAQREQGLRWLETKVKETAAPGWADKLKLPEEYITLMTMTDGLVGPGLPSDREANGFICFVDVLSNKVPLLEELKETLLIRSDQDRENYEVCCGLALWGRLEP
jgi:hypothetical protein